MTNPSSLPKQDQTRAVVTPETPEITAQSAVQGNPEFTPTQPQDSYVKLAMRNMVRKGGTSLKHFFLTVIGLLTLFVGLAYLTKP